MSAVVHALPLDPALPHLAHAMDAAIMAEVFARLLRERGVGVDSCRIERAIYRPRHNCTLSYLLRLRDAGGTAFEQRVGTRICTAGESAQRFAAAGMCGPIVTSAGPLVSHIPELNMVAHWWPNDPKLGRTAEVLWGSEALRTQAIGEVVAVLTQGRGETISHKVTLAQFVPEQRVCARVEIEYRAGPLQAAQRQTVYAKADAKRQGLRTHAVMQALRQSVAQREGRLRTPMPILWQNDLGLHWQAALTGHTLLDEAPAIGAADSIRIGELLASLHGTPIPECRRLDVQGIVSRIHEVAETLASVEPQWEALLRPLRELLCQGVSLLQNQRDVTLHGDLRRQNILADNGRFSLIDLDSVRTGPAVVELGDWIAGALYRAMIREQSAWTEMEACRAFLQGYRANSGDNIAESTLAWSTATSLLCQRARGALMYMKPGRFLLIKPLLQLALAIARSGSIDAAFEAPQRIAA